jgi:hypothetical protein
MAMAVVDIPPALLERELRGLNSYNFRGYVCRELLP